MGARKTLSAELTSRPNGQLLVAFKLERDFHFGAVCADFAILNLHVELNHSLLILHVFELFLIVLNGIVFYFFVLYHLLKHVCLLLSSPFTYFLLLKELFSISLNSNVNTVHGTGRIGVQFSEGLGASQLSLDLKVSEYLLVWT